MAGVEWGVANLRAYSVAVMQSNYPGAGRIRLTLVIYPGDRYLVSLFPGDVKRQVGISGNRRTPECLQHHRIIARDEHFGDVMGWNDLSGFFDAAQTIFHRMIDNAFDSDQIAYLQCPDPN